MAKSSTCMGCARDWIVGGTKMPAVPCGLGRRFLRIERFYWNGQRDPVGYRCYAGSRPCPFPAALDVPVTIAGAEVRNGRAG